MNTLEARRRLLGRNVYKKTVEGNPAIAQGSLARRYPGITMQGWTEQAQYEGNQLFDASVFDGMENSGVSVSATDGVITASGMSESAIWIQSANFTEEDLKKFKSGNIYVKNYKTADCNYEVGIYINNTTVNEGNSPHTIPDGYLETKPNNVYFFIDIRAGIELKGSCKPMIYQDGDGTYEPYTGGQPSPSPEYPQEIISAGKYDEGTQKYQYEVKLTGANLFNPEKLTGGEIVEYNGVQCYKYTDNSTNFTYIDDFAENTQYCISVRALQLEENENRLVTIKINYTDGSTQRRTFSANELVSFASSVDKTIESISGEDSYSIVCYLDLSMTTLGIGTEPLPFQPYKEQTVTLTSDRPLTKWDNLEKRNGQWGWVYKSEEIESYTDESVPGEYFSTTGQLSTGAQVWYETAEETFVPLSESEQEAMNALYTFRPTTVLSNDCDCNMSLTYKTKKSLEVTD